MGISMWGWLIMPNNKVKLDLICKRSLDHKINCNIKGQQKNYPMCWLCYAVHNNMLIQLNKFSGSNRPDNGIHDFPNIQ